MATDHHSEGETIALIPAGGRASRLGRWPGSKEVVPLTWAREGGQAKAFLACEGLLEALKTSGIEKAVVILDHHKVDILRFFGEWSGPPQVVLAPLAQSPSVPHSLDRAFPWIRQARVALGFPDVIFEPLDAFRKLELEMSHNNADIVLGLFPAADRTASTDMVAIDAQGRVESIESRPQQSRLRYNWLLALWGPSFSRALNHWLKEVDELSELRLSSLFNRAIEEGMNVIGVRFPRGKWWDLGTPEGFQAAQRRILEKVKVNS